MCDGCVGSVATTRREFLKAAAAAALSGEYFFRGRASARANPIRIGAPLPLSGPSAPLGYHSLWGLQAALKRIELMGGINGRPVQLIVEDDAGNPADAVRIMRKMILQKEVDGVIAGVVSQEALPMVPVAAQLQTLFLVTVAESELVTADNCNRYTFRLAPDARHKARAFAPFMVSRITPRWSFIYWDVAWGQSLLKFFGEELERNGGRVVDAIPVPVGTTDYSPYLAKLKSPGQSPGLFHAVAGSDAVRLTKQIGEFGLQRQYRLAGTCDVIFPETFDEQAPDVDGAYIVEQYLVKPAAPLNSPEDEQFRSAFREISKGIPPGPHSWASYEWAFIYKRAVEQVNYRSKEDTMKVVEALEGMKGNKSGEYPQGPFTIRKEDHQGLLNLYIWQLRSGKAEVLKVVSPEESYYPPAPSCRMA